MLRWREPHPEHRIAIIPPRGAEVHAWWNRLLRERRSIVQVLSPADCQRYLIDEATRAYVVLGDHSWRDLFGGSVGKALHGKAVYRFGCSAAAEGRALLAEGLAAFVGYSEHLMAYLGGRWGDAFFSPAVFAGVDALCDRKPIAAVEKGIQHAWISTMVELSARASHADGDTLNLIYAQHALDHLFVLGDMAWKVPRRPTVVVLDALQREHEYQGDDVEQLTPTRNEIVEEFGQRDLVARFELIDISPILLGWLQADPMRVAQLSPEQFENLVAERLRANDYTVQKCGGTYHRDGGIDLIAVPNRGEVPGVIAVQVKHSTHNRTVGSAVVRDLAGVLSRSGLNAGIIVTNTRFTPDARWFAQQMGSLIRLRDLDDLRRWLQNEFGGDDVYDELPRSIQLAPGLEFPVPRPTRPIGRRKPR
jgi:hypothetical protein